MAGAQGIHEAVQGADSIRVAPTTKAPTACASLSIHDTDFRLGAARMTRRADLLRSHRGILHPLAGLAVSAAALCVGAHALATGIDPGESAQRIAKYRLSDTRCATAPDRDSAAASATQEQALELAEPVASERRPLTWNPALTAAAEQYARAMAEQGFFAHTAPDGTTLARRVDRTAYRWRSIAANLAAGYATLDDTLQAWVHSPGHCRNLLDGRYSEFGVARVRSKRAADRYGVYWVLVLAQPAVPVTQAKASR